MNRHQQRGLKGNSPHVRQKTRIGLELRRDNILKREKSSMSKASAESRKSDLLSQEILIEGILCASHCPKRQKKHSTQNR